LIIGAHFHLTHADGSAAWSLLALAQTGKATAIYPN